jgi:hypothetical protein
LLHEPDVALTDYGLAVECLLFVWLLSRSKTAKGTLRGWYQVFFSALATASLAGGTLHGFFAENTTVGSRFLWKGTLVAIGAAALAAWFVGLHMRFPLGTARALAPVLTIAFVAYCAVVLWVRDDYVVAIVSYLPAALFWLAMFVLAYRDTRQRPALVGVIGVLLTFAAAGVQQSGVALHPVYFDHNALYHAIQAVALFFLYRTASWSVGLSP